MQLFPAIRCKSSCKITIFVRKKRASVVAFFCQQKLAILHFGLFASIWAVAVHNN